MTDDDTPAAEQVARGLRAVVARTRAAAVVRAKMIAKAWRTFHAVANREEQDRDAERLLMLALVAFAVPVVAVWLESFPSNDRDRQEMIDDLDP